MGFKMKKSVTVILSIFCVFLTLAVSSCTRTPPPNDNYGFISKTINKDQKEDYNLGDEIIIDLYLVNGSGKKQIITHKGDKPLYCVIYCGTEIEYSETDEAENTTILRKIYFWEKCIGGIDKTVTYKFEKAGTYTIKTYSEFTEYGKAYRYDADDIIIAVSE